jgi:hypothetical protein
MLQASMPSNKKSFLLKKAQSFDWAFFIGQLLKKVFWRVKTPDSTTFEGIKTLFR